MEGGCRAVRVRTYMQFTPAHLNGPVSNPTIAPATAPVCALPQLMLVRHVQGYVHGWVVEVGVAGGNGEASMSLTRCPLIANSKGGRLMMRSGDGVAGEMGPGTQTHRGNPAGHRVQQDTATSLKAYAETGA
jgi:hypothetical protein